MKAPTHYATLKNTNAAYFGVFEARKIETADIVPVAILGPNLLIKRRDFKREMPRLSDDILSTSAG